MLLSLSGNMNQKAIIDDEDFDNLSKYHWYAAYDNSVKSFYAVRETCGTASMHRFILKMAKGDKRQVDHIDHNTLNNTKANLRIVSKTQNMYNARKRKDNTTGYKGVSRDRRRGTFTAQIVAGGIKTYLGNFGTAEQASEAYLKAASELHGEYQYKGE